jgi:magnesium-transporting ATPase (P-type)
MNNKRKILAALMAISVFVCAFVLSPIADDGDLKWRNYNYPLGQDKYETIKDSEGHILSVKNIATGEMTPFKDISSFINWPLLIFVFIVFWVIFVELLFFYYNERNLEEHRSLEDTEPKFYSLTQSKVMAMITALVLLFASLLVLVVIKSIENILFVFGLVGAAVLLYAFYHGNTLLAKAVYYRKPAEEVVEQKKVKRRMKK